MARYLVGRGRRDETQHRLCEISLLPYGTAICATLSMQPPISPSPHLMGWKVTVNSHGVIPTVGLGSPLTTHAAVLAQEGQAACHLIQGREGQEQDPEGSLFSGALLP